MGSTTLSVAAAGIVILCTLVMLTGIDSSSQFNVCITILNVGVLTFFVGVGATRVDPSNWVVYRGTFVPYGAAAVFAGAGRVFFSYLGFDMVSSLAEETKNPQKTVPRGIIGSLFVAALIYVLYRVWLVIGINFGIRKSMLRSYDQSSSEEHRKIINDYKS